MPSSINALPHLVTITIIPHHPSHLRNLPQSPNRTPRSRSRRCPVGNPTRQLHSSTSEKFQPLHPSPCDQSDELSQVKKKKYHIRNRPRPTRHRLLADLAAPDPDTVSLDRRLAAKSAHVAGVLADFHLLDLFAQGGAVSGFVRSLEELIGR